MSAAQIFSESEVLTNQKRILDNQAALLKNQDVIKNNQNDIKRNQEKLDVHHEEPGKDSYLLEEVRAACTGVPGHLTANVGAFDVPFTSKPTFSPLQLSSGTRNPGRAGHSLPKFPVCHSHSLRSGSFAAGCSTDRDDIVEPW